MLKIKNTLAVKMLEACGLRTPTKWTLGRLRGKLLSLDLFLAEDKWKDLKKPIHRKLFKRCWKASINKETDLLVYNEAGETYGPTGAYDPNEERTEEMAKKKKVVRRKKKDTDEKTKTKKKVVKKTSKKKDKAKDKAKDKKKKTERKEVAKSKFGHRIGSQAADIDVILTKKGMTIKEIAKAAKVPEKRATNYLRYAMKKGFVEKTKNDKFRVA